MPLYMLNESRSRDVANDIDVFRSLASVAEYIEPVDVENGEFFLFDSDGFFYSIEWTGTRDRYIFARSLWDMALVRKLVQDYLTLIGLTYDATKNLEGNIEKIERGM